MIHEYNSKRFCCEDISLIENYKQAIADESQVWHCHHRKETDEGLSKQELIKMGLYWHRPACELIFLTETEHYKLHFKGKKRPNISKAMKGKPSPNKGKPSPLKGKKRPNMSASLKGNKNGKGNKGKSKPLTKYKWLTPVGEIKIMSAHVVSRCYPDWVRIEPVGE